MKISVVISPFKAVEGRSRTFHAAFAKLLCLKLAQNGLAPYAPHLFCPQFLDDDLPQDRDLGIEIGKTIIERAGELCVWDAWGISSGMAHEIAWGMEVDKERAVATWCPPLRIRYFSRGEIPEWNAVAAWLESTGAPAGQLIPVLRDFKGIP